MQPDASNAKQLIVERVRQSTNILVAVSTSPSVDALSAALGLALMLNKLDKHATAVFSGTLPPAMEFLNPGKTFENSVDSLRDFIISLDKEKADRLRYKVEDDAVRIFITPYRTIISEKDLQFSQGDFNVDLIIGLGVEKRDDLDAAIVAHGRILHDATVITINANNQQSSLGSVDWHEAEASSLCEMLVSLSEGMQKPGLLDSQIATALLTGIVAATDRFSNEHTSPRVMTMSAQLMAAGANQQLIANNLIKTHELSAPSVGELLPGATSIKVVEPAQAETPNKNGELDIVHPAKKEEPAREQAPQQSAEQSQPAAQLQQPKGERTGRRRGRGGQNNQNQSAEDQLAAALPSAAAATSAFDELKNAIETDGTVGSSQSAILGDKKAPGSQAVNGGDDEDAPKSDDGFIASTSSWRGKRLEPPAMGGTLNATAEQAMDDSRKAEDQERNQKMLTHPGDVKDTTPSSKAPATEPESAPVVMPEPQQSVAPVQDIEPASAAPAQVGPSAAVETPPTIEPIMPEQPAPEPVAAAEPAAPAVEQAPAPQPEPVVPPLEMPPLPEIELPQPEPAAPTAEPVAEPAPADRAPEVGVDLDAARQAVDAALLNPAPSNVEPITAATPADFAAPQTPPPFDANGFATSPTPSAEPQGMTALPPMPPMPPMLQQDAMQPLPPPPSLNELPPLPDNIPTVPAVAPLEVAPAPAPEPPAVADPKQYQIPGA